jgi:pyrroloquinoline quinone biosynthesis protein B
LQASIAVSFDGSEWLIVNATTDIRRQLEFLRSPSDKAMRSTPVRAVILTDANIDHAAGLLELRQAQALQICSTAVVRKALVGGNSMFDPLSRGERDWSVFATSDESVDLPVFVPGLRVIAIPAVGLLPSYAGGTPRRGAVTAFCFETRNGRRYSRLLYAPVFLRMNASLLRAAEECNAIFFDGSFWSDDELPSLGLGSRSARAMGHAPIGGTDGWLGAIAGRAKDAVPHRYCTHVNNSNPILDPQSQAARALTDASFSVAVEGAEIVLDARG